MKHSSSTKKSTFPATWTAYEGCPFSRLRRHRVRNAGSPPGSLLFYNGKQYKRVSLLPISQVTGYGTQFYRPVACFFTTASNTKGCPFSRFRRSPGTERRFTARQPVFFHARAAEKLLLLFTNLHKVQKSSFTKFIDKGTDLLYISVVRVRFLRCCRLFALRTEAAGSL